jgi:hypothetical protein
MWVDKPTRKRLATSRERVLPVGGNEGGPYFKVEAFIQNLFNHSNALGLMSTGINNPNFGVFNGALGSRCKMLVSEDLSLVRKSSSCTRVTRGYKD